jgi:hypothetical protein
MADLGQNRSGLEMKVLEVKIRIRQKKAAIDNIETERLTADLAVKRAMARVGEFDENIKTIQEQIKQDEKDLASLETALQSVDK